MKPWVRAFLGKSVPLAAPGTFRSPRRAAGRVPRLSTGALLAAGSALAYGSLAVLAKLAYAEGWNVPSLLAARFGVAALVLAPFALRGGGSWRAFGGAFLLGAVGYATTTALYFPSLRLLPAAVASFLLFLAPAFVAVLSRVFLKERLGARGYAALALALGGLALISAGAFTGALSPLGVVLATGSAVSYSVAVLLGRVVVRELPWMRAAFGTCLGAFATYLVVSLATGRLVVPPSAPGIAYAVAIAVVATAVALALFYAALTRIGASRTSLVSTLEPASTLVFAAIVLLETPSWASVAGGALILAAAALVALEGEEAPVGVPPAAGP
jgi:drug/metabolite transporter (DMT)-like permease